MSESKSNEPMYTRGYSNETICNYFYYLSIVVLALGVLVVSLHVYILVVGSPKMRMTHVGGLVASLIQVGLGYYLYLFSYLVCSRSLLDKKQ